jgi:hypothetical protein
MAEIDLQDPFIGIRGGYKRSAFILRVINGRTFASARPKTRDVQSDEQVAVRATTGAVARSWASITEDQRVGWQRYAEAFLPTIVNGRLVRRRGYDVFKQANSRRRFLGLDTRQAPPIQAPPPAITSIQLNAFESANNFSFRLTHPITLVDGHFVSIMITPATVSSGRKAMPENLRMIKGVGAASAAPLCESGGGIAFADCRFSIEPGQRFLVEARVIRADDGMPSTEIRTELWR